MRSNADRPPRAPLERALLLDEIRAESRSCRLTSAEGYTGFVGEGARCCRAALREAALASARCRFQHGARIQGPAHVARTPHSGAMQAPAAAKKRVSRGWDGAGGTARCSILEGVACCPRTRRPRSWIPWSATGKWRVASPPSPGRKQRWGPLRAGPKVCG